MSKRRISAPHAKHFITSPGTPLLTVPYGGQKYAQTVVVSNALVGEASSLQERRGFGALEPNPLGSPGEPWRHAWEGVIQCD